MSELPLSPNSRLALQAAHETAAALGHQLTTTAHLLMGILQTGDTDEPDFGPSILQRYRISHFAVEYLLKSRLGERDELKPPRPLARETQDALERAEAVREKLEDELIRTEHLLIGIAANRMNVGAHILNLETVQAEIWRRRRPVA